MQRGQWIPIGLLATALLAAGAVRLAPAADLPEDELSEQLTLGRKLFMHDWSRPESWEASVELGAGGDGLGPMYNAASCVGCHNLGGIGGAGTNEGNVDLLHVPRPHGRALSLRRSTFLKRAARIHPGFEDGLSVTLHRFGRDNSGNEFPYRAWRSRFLGPFERKRLDPDRPTRRIDGITVHLTQRNTPALFGAGIIDAVSDETLIRTANQQRSSEKVSGRVARTSTGAVGRFGWRGQAATLHDFVLGACANELGLTVPGHVQAENALARLERSESSRLALPPDPQRAALLDLTDEQCRALTRFVSTVAPAEPLLERGTPERIEKGQTLFAAIGCAECHVPDLGPAQGIYSDLLLHDLGEQLSDPLAAFSESAASEPPRTSAGYSGGTGFRRTRETEFLQQEWRTPPLWGIALSGPYLHDGRAATMEDAIRLHGGEAEDAAARFRRLSPKESELVLQFLDSLPAPTALSFDPAFVEVPDPKPEPEPGPGSRGDAVSTGFCSPSPPSGQTRLALGDDPCAAGSSPGPALASRVPRR